MTVAELADILSRCDPAATVVIHDADTDWWLHLETIAKTRDTIIVGGNYQNRANDDYHENDDYESLLQ